MSRGFPSMTALLALLAIAGYQNRDKIAEMLRGSGQDTPEADKQNGLGGLVGQLGLGGASAGGILSGGLGELLERFKQSGGDTAESWVGTGPNKPCTADQLERAIGSEVLDHLSRQTGLTRDAVLSRLCRELTDAVDKDNPRVISRTKRISSARNFPFLSERWEPRRAARVANEFIQRSLEWVLYGQSSSALSQACWRS